MTWSRPISEDTWVVMARSEAEPVRTACRYCGTLLGATLLDLGEHPLSNAFPTASEAAKEKRYPLIVKICPSCHLVQAVHDIPPGDVFTPGYVYFSSMSDSWVAHAERYALDSIERYRLGPASFVIEVASNDGYLLRHFDARGIPTLGIEPTESTANAAEELGLRVERAYFGSELAQKLLAAGVQADLIVANNVLAHVPDIADFVAGFRTLLKPDGVANFEFPHLGSLVEHAQFDTIYHEHYSYLSLLAVDGIFGRQGLRVFDVEQLGTHGGSLRVSVCHPEARHATTPNVAAVLSDERRAGFDTDAGFPQFSTQVEAIIASFKSFLRQAKLRGETVAAYGAAAKGNTFLNACGVTAADIICVGDRAPSKQGKVLPGSHIPVVAPERLLALEPRYIVILPWNLKKEISKQLAVVRDGGTEFVVAIPILRIF